MTLISRYVASALAAVAVCISSLANLNLLLLRFHLVFSDWFRDVQETGRVQGPALGYLGNTLLVTLELVAIAGSMARPLCWLILRRHYAGTVGLLRPACRGPRSLAVGLPRGPHRGPQRRWRGGPRRSIPSLASPACPKRLAWRGIPPMLLPNDARGPPPPGSTAPCPLTPRLGSDRYGLRKMKPILDGNLCLICSHVNSGCIVGHSSVIK